MYTRLEKLHEFEADGFKLYVAKKDKRNWIYDNVIKNFRRIEVMEKWAVWDWTQREKEDSEDSEPYILGENLDNEFENVFENYQEDINIWKSAVNEQIKKLWKKIAEDDEKDRE